MDDVSNPFPGRKRSAKSKVKYGTPGFIELDAAPLTLPSIGFLIGSYADQGEFSLRHPRGFAASGDRWPPGVEEPGDKWSGQMDEQKQGWKGLSPESMIGGNFNIVDHEKFARAIQLLKESLWDKGATLFSADNLITWNKNLSFLRDPFCYGILTDEHASVSEKSIIWRTYILLHFAEFACGVEGDFAEFGCYKGHTAWQLVRKLNLGALGKRLYLYDLFEWKKGDAHTRHAGLDNPYMYEDVCERFRAFDFVRVIKGSVPGSFEQGFPEKIAFAHIDMNHPDPEVGALKAILPRLTRGGVVILDDYGWWGYSPQKVALDPIIKENGLKVLELPTGQGLLIR